MAANRVATGYWVGRRGPEGWRMYHEGGMAAFSAWDHTVSNASTGSRLFLPSRLYYALRV
jgi:hypothetical protein